VEEKYLYTIAIVVIFAGFLFTSVGTYTGRPVIDVAESLEYDYSSTPGSSSSGVSSECNNGDEVVVDQSRGSYSICENGQWSTELSYCHPGEEALQRGNGVVCSE